MVRSDVNGNPGRRHGRGAFWAIAAAFLLSFGGCLLGGGETAKRGSEVENEVYGVLVDASSHPAAGARVRAYATDGFPLSVGSGNAASKAVDSTEADEGGEYRFRNLPAGEYNLIAEQPGLAGFIPRVAVVDGAPPRNLGVDTLRAPGSIRGRIAVGGAGKEGAIAYLPGTTYLAVSDENGEFLATGVPQGVYSIHYLVPGFQAGPDTGVTVRAGLETVLPEKELEYDTALPPPAPTSIRATLDTLASVVRVEWSAIRVSDLLGYLVYRDTGALSSPELLTPTILTDTVFLDTVTRIAVLTPPPVVSYRVVSLDRSKNQSLRFSPPGQVFLAPPASAALQVSLRALGGEFGRARPHDSVRFEVAYENPGRPIRQVSWWTDSIAEPVRVRAVTAHAGKDTLAMAWAALGNHTVSVRVTDAAGTSRTYMYRMEILENILVAEAGANRVAYAGDSVLLVGGAWQPFWSEKRYYWDLGATGTFQPAPEGRVTAAVPPIAGASLACILRVVNDDGFEDVDTTWVTAVSAPPKVDAGPDREASASDTVRLQGRAEGVAGPVVLWEWDLGATGRFSPGPPDTFAVMPVAITGTFRCILRATDNHRQTALDTLLITLVSDDPVAEISASPPEALVGGSVTLSAAGSSDRFGRIVRWEWGIGGTGRFVPASGRDTVVAMPEAAGEFRCRLRVTDDDGRSDTAVVNIRVRPKGSWSRASAESPIGPSGSLQVWGTGLGKAWLLRYTWDDTASSRYDLLSSRDMLAWESLPVDTLWRDRSFLGRILEFRGRLWMIQYHPDSTATEIWVSDDGSAWSHLATPAAIRERAGYAIAVFGGRLWVIAGEDALSGRRLADIWSSADGITWEQSAAGAAFGARTGAQAAVHDGQLWILGGLGAGTSGYQDDVWRSVDGKSWTRAGAFPTRIGNSADNFIAHAGQLWVIQPALAWHSADGASWAKNPDPPGFPPIGYPVLLELNGRLWLLESQLEDEADGIWVAPPPGP